jgi:hypothetical protein
MNAKEVKQLAKQIRQDDPRVQIVGTRHYGTGSYSLDAVDTRTGFRFVLDRPEEWDERKRDSEQDT